MHRGTKQGRAGVSGFDYETKPQSAGAEAPVKAPVEKKSALPATVEAHVTNLYLRWQNPRLVSVMIDGRQERCRVRDRAFFTPGMTLQVHPIAAGLGECQDIPRRRPT